MLDYTLTVNGVDLTPYIRFDSYITDAVPVYSREVVTLDGVTHVTQLRTRRSVRFAFNMQDADTTALIASALLVQPCTVSFFSIQNQQNETAKMRIDGQSAEYLAECRLRGKRWNQASDVTLEEL